MGGGAADKKRMMKEAGQRIRMGEGQRTGGTVQTGSRGAGGAYLHGCQVEWLVHMPRPGLVEEGRRLLLVDQTIDVRAREHTVPVSASNRRLQGLRVRAKGRGEVN